MYRCTRRCDLHTVVPRYSRVFMHATMRNGSNPDGGLDFRYLAVCAPPSESRELLRETRITRLYRFRGQHCILQSAISLENTQPVMLSMVNLRAPTWRMGPPLSVQQSSYTTRVSYSAAVLGAPCPSAHNQIHVISNVARYTHSMPDFQRAQVPACNRRSPRMPQLT